MNFIKLIMLILYGFSSTLWTLELLGDGGPATRLTYRRCPYQPYHRLFNKISCHWVSIRRNNFAPLTTCIILDQLERIGSYCLRSYSCFYDYYYRYLATLIYMVISRYIYIINRLI